MARHQEVETDGAEARLFVGHLPNNMDQQALAEEVHRQFAPFGRCSVNAGPFDPNKGRNLKTAFVQFRLVSRAQAALREANRVDGGIYIRGQRVRVSQAEGGKRGQYKHCASRRPAPRPAYNTQAVAYTALVVANQSQGVYPFWAAPRPWAVPQIWGFYPPHAAPQGSYDKTGLWKPNPQASTQPALPARDQEYRQGPGMMTRDGRAFNCRQ
ncbi:hypothetical protein BDV59DRAFT_201037 [Aspergillus ambiguus]|uniref:uncharacterized protein n=1 Tax=Aspergillus ambiguus TaxID=176160 RepID=UPI003CCDDF93